MHSNKVAVEWKNAVLHNDAGMELQGWGLMSLVSIWYD